tara:strand:+ start:1698 stop:2258 length:561 start_codon:yes stop_codon:yes gene_type:complete
MNKQTLVIYDFQILYEILYETKNFLNFNLLNLKKNELGENNLKNQEDYLIISKKNINSINNQIIIKQFPIEIVKLVETININFLKKKYIHQSEIVLGKYILNFNSRKIFNKDKSLDLTEREASIIMFLQNSKNPVNIGKLQTEVWGHNSKLETHTVETHIYRLRKKINNVFNDKNFIKSSKSGYII